VVNTPSPAVDRRRLRAELRRARVQAGLTQEAVAAEMDWSLSKVIRIETGSVGISTNDLKALLRLYHVADAKRTRELLALAPASRKRSWWGKYRGTIPPTYFQYLEYEETASAIRHYESLLIPGLLQTEAYAATVIGQYRANFPAKTAHDRLEIRMTRQRLIDRPNAPDLFFVLDEAVFSRLMGDQVLRLEQIRHLIDLARKPNVRINILPFTAGLHRGMAENFVILEFSSSTDSDVLYFESARDSIFSHGEAEEISIYRELFVDLQRISLGGTGSLAYLKDREAEIRESK
jgi:transcriptional regulator with XRE-family HTH domain